MADDSALNSMIANFMVLEQMVINLTHMVSNAFEDPLAVRTALMQDLRERFALSGVETGEHARRALYQLAHKQMDRLEPRVLGDTSETIKN